MKEQRKLILLFNEEQNKFDEIKKNRKQDKI